MSNSGLLFFLDTGTQGNKEKARTEGGFCHTVLVMALNLPSFFLVTPSVQGVSPTPTGEVQPVGQPAPTDRIGIF